MRARRTIADLCTAMESIAPTRLAESWDNVGLLVGDPAAPLERVLLSVDYTPAVAAEARARMCEAVVAYHPPIFAASKRFTAGSVGFEAARDRIALYSPHTAYDVAAGGTNDLLADALGMVSSARAPLRATPAAALREGEVFGAVGIGRKGFLEPRGRDELFSAIKAVLGIAALLVSGPRDGMVHRAAVCAGAGDDLLTEALDAGAELYLTGELRHHEALRAARRGCTVVCALHSNSERAAMRRMQPRLSTLLADVDVLVSEHDRDPFEVA